MYEGSFLFGKNDVLEANIVDRIKLIYVESWKDLMEGLAEIIIEKNIFQKTENMQKRSKKKIKSKTLT
jgi:hypothetical protein